MRVLCYTCSDANVQLNGNKNSKIEHIPTKSILKDSMFIFSIVLTLQVGNLYLFPAIGISLLIAVLIVYLPILQWLFNTRPVPWLFWIMPIGWGLLYFVLDELRKVIVRAIPWKVSRRIFW
jgi:magnesium-transporting ATPase (P-type)